MAYNGADPSGGAAGGQDQFNYQRNLAQQRANGQQQAGRDAMQRRFAANGASNSGAAIQAEQNSDRGVQSDLENTQGQIGSQEANQAKEFQQQNNQQAFQGQQAGLQRASVEKMQEGELGAKAAQLHEQQSEFGQELPMKQKQLDMEAQKMGMDQEAQNFNMGLATWTQHHSGGLLGGGGALGLGLGVG